MNVGRFCKFAFVLAVVTHDYVGCLPVTRLDNFSYPHHTQMEGL